MAMKQFLLAAGSTDPGGLGQVQAEIPEPGDGEVLVRIHAASLNFRDLAIAAGKYPGGPVQRDTVPLSDGAGEVVAVGKGVTRFAAGDRVAATFFQGWVSGAPDFASMPSLGYDADGVLTEYAVFAEHGLVPLPEHLSYEEAATLPCAGVTAWHALMGIKPVCEDDTVLLLGTGGVSILGLQLAHMLGAKTIVTSGSDEKLERARELGADETINYKATPEWDEEILRLTGGAGVDHILEVGGVGTLARSFRSVGFGGNIALIGVLGGPEGDTNPQPLMLKNASLTGIFVGDRSTFEAMNDAIATNGLRLLVDRVFEFDAAPEAYQWQHEGRHFGKIVVSVG
jgi:NADPH:quinone reductase-like Zn-dependent oxidoreductase